MNLRGSSNKHPLNPKRLQNKVIQGESRGFKPRAQRKHKLPVRTYVKNRGTSSSLDPAPSSLPLQEGNGFSQPSFELSSSEGVWLPKKWKEKERK